MNYGRHSQKLTERTASQTEFSGAAPSDRKNYPRKSKLTEGKGRSWSRAWHQCVSLPTTALGGCTAMTLPKASGGVPTTIYPRQNLECLAPSPREQKHKSCACHCCMPRWMRL